MGSHLRSFKGPGSLKLRSLGIAFLFPIKHGHRFTCAWGCQQTRMTYGG